MNTKEMVLSQVKQGMTVTVQRLLSGSGMRRRLLDMGLIEGTEVTCLYSSPSGDPTAFLVRGTVIALRKQDAEQIQVCLGVDRKGEKAPALETLAVSL